MKDIGLSPSLVTYNVMLNVYGKMGRSWDEILSLFNETKSNGYSSGTVTYNALLQEFGKAGLYSEALSILKEMENNKYAPDSVTYNELVAAYVRAGFSDGGAAMIGTMTVKSLMQNAATYTTVISAYGKAWKEDKALELFYRMKESGCVPTVVKLAFQEMKNCGFEPERDTFHTLISAYGRCESEIDAAKMSDEMIKAGFTPCVTTYNALLNTLTRRRDGNMFWSRPENICRVYGICGKFGICSSNSPKPCECSSGFSPVDDRKWKSGDFSCGCRLENYSSCDANDGFEEVGIVGFKEGDIDLITFTSSLSLCKKACLDNCSCIGLNHQEGANLCRNLYGYLLSLRNLSSDSTGEEKLLLRVQNGGLIGKKTKKLNPSVLIFSIIGSVVVLGFFAVMVRVLLKRSRKSKKGGEEDGVLQLLTLKVFSYKELHVATRDFSEKLGHGGFETVFRGQLLDSTIVAVKRLERPGGGEKEFRAEVCTIGNIHHVNLVRLRGFCSDNSHRLLVYEYMPRFTFWVILRTPILSNFKCRLVKGMERAFQELVKKEAHEMLRLISESGIQPDLVIYNSLMDMYARRGECWKAEDILEDKDLLRGKICHGRGLKEGKPEPNPVWIEPSADVSNLLGREGNR